MASVQVQINEEAQSYSSYYPSLGASILAAAMLNAALPPQHPDVALNELPVWIYEAGRGGIAQSFQAAKIEQGSTDRQLIVALQSLYDELASSQQELEVETKKILYSNLWSLYA